MNVNCTKNTHYFLPLFNFNVILICYDVDVFRMKKGSELIISPSRLCEVNINKNNGGPSSITAYCLRYFSKITVINLYFRTKIPTAKVIKNSIQTNYCAYTTK